MDTIAANYISSSDSEVDSEPEQKRAKISDSTEELNKEANLKLPTVPSTVLDKYYVSPNILKYTEEMSNLVGIKTGFRTGQFRSFIFLEWRPTSLQRQQLVKSINQFNENLTKTKGSNFRFDPLFISSLGSPEPLHVSLSKSIVCESITQRNLFYRELKKELQSVQIQPFTLTFTNKPLVLTAKQDSSMFLCLEVNRSHRTKILKPIQDAISSALETTFSNQSDIIMNFQVSNEYLHMSIAQMTNCPPSSANLKSSSIDWEPFHGLDEIKVPCKEVKCLINRQLYSIPIS
ncbi:hypothetical protein Kpol_1036p71 [Vanderwaltozyma polyspora DSM 70294]|uniref:U6 snRNA phosphodiesterase 1 n=1 Tax=Vanderwaltozyma polyspora (strain ATCC 22028 / DSM 70294 / BCRC 21397 / CBS 2163 / NBRC 10782 / NRRL Y-8283 / UCD 57-17) TaxID=436907 RepID=A7TEL8_VANPO|nr:uncharacterized protein Kpol_1036p71 [Vanderwaltozyma polyspora DSM 70294]EDO19325.1 hypothetical protein Kpol_1036p71 [Vanderwaltozyma polyspora DSM 70294]